MSLVKRQNYIEGKYLHWWPLPSLGLPHLYRVDYCLRFGVLLPNLFLSELSWRAAASFGKMHAILIKEGSTPWAWHSKIVTYAVREHPPTPAPSYLLPASWSSQSLHIALLAQSCGPAPLVEAGFYFSFIPPPWIRSLTRQLPGQHMHHVPTLAYALSLLFQVLSPTAWTNWAVLLSRTVTTYSASPVLCSL